MKPLLLFVNPGFPLISSHPSSPFLSPDSQQRRESGKGLHPPFRSLSVLAPVLPNPPNCKSIHCFPLPFWVWAAPSLMKSWRAKRLVADEFARLMYFCTPHSSKKYVCVSKTVDIEARVFSKTFSLFRDTCESRFLFHAHSAGSLRILFTYFFLFFFLFSFCGRTYANHRSKEKEKGSRSDWPISSRPPVPPSKVAWRLMGGSIPVVPHPTSRLNRVSHFTSFPPSSSPLDSPPNQQEESVHGEKRVCLNLGFGPICYKRTVRFDYWVKAISSAEK